MTERVQVLDSQSAQALAREYAGKPTHDGAPKIAPFQARDVTNERYSVNGVGPVTQHGVSAGSSAIAKDGTVRLPNGQVTDIEVAKLNGWIREEPNGSFTLIDEAFAAGKTPGQTQQQQPADKTEANGESGKLFAESDAIMDKLDANTSADQRSLAAKSIIEDGDLEAAARAIGASPAEMGTLEKAYAANAATVTTEMGLPDPYFMALVLTPAEQQAARKAAVSNDRQQLRAFAAETLSRMDNPLHNKALVEELEELGLSVHANNGTTLVHIPGVGTRSLRAAIREGFIKTNR